MPRATTPKPTTPETPTAPPLDSAPAETVAPAETAAPPVAPPVEDPAKDEAANPDAIPSNDVDQKTEPEPVVKSGFRKVRVKDFTGSYGRVKFDDNGVCEAIDEETFNLLRKQFPGAEVEFLD